MPPLIARISVLFTAASALVNHIPSFTSRRCNSPTISTSGIRNIRTNDVSMSALFESGVDPVTTSVILGAALVATSALSESVEQERDNIKNGKSSGMVDDRREKPPSPPPDSAAEAIAENMAEVRATIENAGKAAQRFRERIQKSAKSIEVTEQEVQATKEDVEKVEETIVETIEEPEDVVEVVEDVTKVAEDVTEAVENAAEVTEDITGVVEDVEEVVQEVAQAESREESKIMSQQEKAAAVLAALAAPVEPAAPVERAPPAVDTLSNPDIGDIKKQVASTLRGEMEKTNRLHDSPDSPDPKTIIQLKMQEQVKNTPFVVKLIKKVVFPWKKFSNL